MALGGAANRADLDRRARRGVRLGGRPVQLGDGVQRASERIRGHARTLVPPGLTLVVSAGCRECVRARAALDAIDGTYSVMDSADAERYGIQSLTVPYAFVGSATGDLVMVRRGTSVTADAVELTEAGRRHAVETVR